MERKDKAKSIRCYKDIHSNPSGSVLMVSVISWISSSISGRSAGSTCKHFLTIPLTASLIPPSLAACDDPDADWLLVFPLTVLEQQEPWIRSCSLGTLYEWEPPVYYCCNNSARFLYNPLHVMHRTSTANISTMQLTKRCFYYPISV